MDMNPGNIPRIRATFIKGLRSLKRSLDIVYDTDKTKKVEIIQVAIETTSVFVNQRVKLNVVLSVSRFI